jgi:hypothetical protein
LYALANDESALLTALAVWDTVMVLVPFWSRVTVTPGAIVTVSVVLEIGEAGAPFT